MPTKTWQMEGFFIGNPFHFSEMLLLPSWLTESVEPNTRLMGRLKINYYQFQILNLLLEIQSWKAWTRRVKKAVGANLS